MHVVEEDGKRKLLGINEKVYPDGKLDLKNGYSIVKMVYHSLGYTYISYIAGCVIEGPRGGRYMIDNFGIERLFPYFGIRVQQGINCRLLDKNENIKVTSKCLIRNKQLMEGKTEEESVARYSKVCGYKYIKRCDVKDFIAKIIR